MNPSNKANGSLDDGLLVSGFVMGLLFGGLITLFRAPKRGTVRQQPTEANKSLTPKPEVISPIDPNAESLAEGKAAARRRRVELGM